MNAYPLAPPFLATRWVRHGLFWLGVGGFMWLIRLPDPSFPRRDITAWMLVTVQLPSYMVATYLLVNLLIPRFLLRRKLLYFGLAVMGWLVGSAFVLRLFTAFYEFTIAPTFLSIPARQPFSGAYFAHFFPGGGLFFINLVAGLASCATLGRYWYQQQRQHQQLSQQRLSTELALLKMQLQPEFLFTTLAYLYELTRLKSNEAPSVVLNLSQLLRYLLYESRAPWVRLEEEVEMLQHYVALEAARYGEQIAVSLSFTGAIEGHQIAPLVLLPFVEHAFRVSTSDEPDQAWIHINGHVSNHQLRFKVITSRSEQNSVTFQEEGADLQRIRRRLTLLYEAQYTLTLIPESDTLVVILDLPVTHSSVPVLRSSSSV